MKNDFTVPEAVLRQQAAKDAITHLSTGIAVFGDGQLLVVRRAQNDFLGGNYELPGGGIDAGESFEQSVARELLEETGLKLEAITGMFSSFEYETPTKPKVRQLNFLVTAAGSVRLSDEHDAFAWIVDNSDFQKLESTPLMRSCVRNALAAYSL
jgi:8-oxo-dGTP diphosphatase